MNSTYLSKAKSDLINRATLMFNVTVILIGILVLIGWQFDITLFKSVTPKYPSMNPLSAVVFILSGTSLLIYRFIKSTNGVRVFTLLAVTILLIGLWRLTAYVFGFETQLDTILFHDAVSQHDPPGRIAPMTSMGFVLIGNGFLLLRYSKQIWWSQVVAIAVLFLVIVPVLNYSFGEPNFKGWGIFTQMALHTCLCFMTVGHALFFAHTDKGATILFTGNGLGSYQFRWFLPTTLVSVIALGWLLIKGEQKGYYDAYFGIIILVAALLILMAVLISSTSFLLNRKEDQINYLGNLVKGVSDAIASTDEDFRIISWNRASELLYGYSHDEVKGKQIQSVLRPQETEERTEEIRAELAKNSSWKGQVTYLKKDGTPIVVLLSVSLLKTPSGAISGYVILTQDMTERNRAEEQILVFGDVVKNSTNGLFVFACRGEADPLQLVIINEVGKHFSTQPLACETGAVLDDILPYIDHSFRQTLKEIALGSGTTVQTELVYREANGVEHFVSVSAYSLPNHKVGLTFEDITERKQQELRLKVSEERHRLFFENSQGYLCTHDLNGVLLSLNESAATNLGYKPQDMIGRNLSEFLMEKYVVQFEEYLKLITREGSAVGLMALRTGDGETKNWLFKNTLISYEGKEYVIGTAIDLTDRLQLEKDLRTAISMAEQAVEAKDNFLANMSHEIRTPMNAIMGFTDVLAKTEMTDEQSSYVESVQTAGRNLITIINDILDLSKIESGKLDIDQLPFDPQAVVTHVYHLLGRQAQEKNLEFTLKGLETLPNTVIGDGNRLSQVLINLIGNAIKFTAKGSIHIDVNMTHASDDIHLFHLSVKDTGIGISKDKQDLIFERFTQANNDTTRTFGGTGLGLSIAKWLVELQGGNMWVVSEEGKGSDFRFTIPYKIVEEMNEKIEKSTPFQPEPVKNAKILLCEDNVLNQRLARVVIEGFGFDLTIANNGKEGVDLLRNHSFEMILMDLQMPEMDGYMATEAIRKELKMDIPIVAMTAHSLVGEREKCLERGMNDYISKPFNQDELYLKIITAIKLNETKKSEKHQASSDQATAPKLVSLDYLRTLSGGNKAFEVEMIELFLDQTPPELKSLQEAYQSSNYSEVKKLAHKLKSSVAIVKSEPILFRLSELEIAGKEEVFDEDTDETMEGLIAAGEVCFEELKGILAREY